MVKLKFSLMDIVITDDIHNNLLQYDDLISKLEKLLSDFSNIQIENASVMYLGKHTLLITYVNPDLKNNPYLFCLCRENGKNFISRCLDISLLKKLENNIGYWEEEILNLKNNILNNTYNNIIEEDKKMLKLNAQNYDNNENKAITTKTLVREELEDYDLDL